MVCAKLKCKKITFPETKIGVKKKTFKLSAKSDIETELNLYFNKVDFFPKCRYVARDVNTNKKRAQFLALMEMIQGNCIEFVGDVRVFLSHYFDLNEDDLKNIAEIVKHKSPFLDSLFFVKKYYTDSVKYFLTALNYKEYELVVDDWDNIPEIEPLLKEIVTDLANMKVFVSGNQEFFPLTGFNLSQLELPPKSSFSYRFCRHTNFTEAVLKQANFQGAVASYANFTHADLTGSDFTRSTLMETHFNYANLQGANFTAAKMQGAYLNEADLRNANFTNADLTGAKLAGANLNGAILTQATIFMADIAGWNFTGVHLEEASFKHNLPQVFSQQDITTYLSHSASSLLLTLNSIPWVYEPSKIKLMEEFISRLLQSSSAVRPHILTYRPNLLSVLLSHSAYVIHSNVIVEFIKEVLLTVPPLLTQTNTEAHYFTELELISLFTNFIEPCVFEGLLPDFYTRYSTAINQILFACRGKSADLQAKGRKLAELYHSSLPDWLKIVCARDGLDLNIDFSNTLDDYMMVFLPLSQNPLTEVLVCSSHYYETHGLDRDKGTSWTGFQIITKRSVTNEASYTQNNHVNDLFNIVPMLKEPFRKKNGLGLMGLFLTELGLPENSKKIFVAAFSKALFTQEEENRLYFQGIDGEPRAQAIIETWLKNPEHNDEKVQVSPFFLKTMDRIFHCDIDPETKKVTLVLISGIFARLSSRIFYGTDMSSVFFLRLLALACMNTAEMFPNQLLEEWTLTQWQGQLQDQTKCSEVISNGIIQVGRRSASQIASYVIPTIW